MRKANSSVHSCTRSAIQSSWTVQLQFQPVALDPAHWSRRSRQVRRWQIFEIERWIHYARLH